MSEKGSSSAGEASGILGSDLSRADEGGWVLDRELDDDEGMCTKSSDVLDMGLVAE